MTMSFLRSNRRFTPLATLFLTVAVVLCAGTVRAEHQATAPAGDVAVVVNPSVPVDSLTIAELRRLLLGDREFWTAGMRVTLLIRAPVARERDAAVRDVCQMTEAQFRQHWIGKVFRADAANGPRIVYSAEMAIDQVARTPGAMTFVAASTAAGVKGGKVLKIEGKLPGQAGYPLK
jgi:ABC-type phosphate transport system substrate-binding protein